MESLTGCTRCGGLIIPEAFRDIGLFSLGWRCLLCGAMVDSVVLRNRAVPSIAYPMYEEPTDSEQESDADEYELEAMTGRLSKLTQHDVTWIPAERGELRPDVKVDPAAL